MLGDRDSEVAIILEDKEMVKHIMLLHNQEARGIKLLVYMITPQEYIASYFPHTNIT